MEISGPFTLTVAGYLPRAVGVTVSGADVEHDDSELAQSAG
ncbi:hypothetical protein ACWDBD_28190 [Streptomyces sp. NPDC001118]